MMWRKHLTCRRDTERLLRADPLSMKETAGVAPSVVL